MRRLAPGHAGRRVAADRIGSHAGRPSNCANGRRVPPIRPAASSRRAPPLAEDAGLLDEARERVLVEGSSAERAVWDVFGARAEALRAQGGRMAERVADLHDVRATDHREPPRPPGPGSSTALGAVRARRARPRARRHRPPRSRGLPRPRDRGGRADLAHRDPRSLARHSGRGRRPRCLVDARRRSPARRRLHRRARLGPLRERGRRGAGDSRDRSVRRPRTHARRHRRSAARQRRQPGVGDGGGRRARAGRRPLPHRVLLPRPRGGAVDRRAGGRLSPRARGASRGSASSSGPSTRAPTSRSPS